MSFELVAPDARHKEGFLAGLREFQAEGLRWHVELDAAWIEAHFDEFVRAERAKAVTRTGTLVPETRLWAIEGGQYAGRLSIRHELNDRLRIVGGHIGYDTRPSMRGRGIATRMLQAALPIARALGLSEALLTCDDANAASIRVIERCGGVLERKGEVEGGVLKRYYWISLIAPGGPAATSA